MTGNAPESLVMVYSTPLEFDAELVKAMLADEEIPSSVENSNGPFPGISVIPCQVFVPIEYEAEARRLVEDHEARHKARLEREEADEEADLDELDGVLEV